VTTTKIASARVIHLSMPLLPFPRPQSRPRRVSSFTRSGDYGVVY